MVFNNQTVIPAVSSFTGINNFLKTGLKYVIIVDFQLAELKHVIDALKKHNKKVLVHIDMIKGLSADEYGAIHLIQNYQVDGIISIKPKVIEVAKKRNVLSIQRLFLKDSFSLKKSIDVLKHSQPDCVEVLPAISGDIIQYISHMIQLPLLCGGLISNEDQIRSALQSGAIGVTVSNSKFWNIS